MQKQSNITLLKPHLKRLNVTKLCRASLLGLTLAASLAGCGGVAGVAAGGNSKTPLAVDFQIDYVGTIPVLNGNPTSSYFYVHNDGDSALTGISYNLAGGSSSLSSSALSSKMNSSVKSKLTAAGDISDAHGFTLKASSLATCSSIAAHSFCAIEFTTPNLSIANQNNSLLQVSILDANGFSHSYDQVLNYSYYNSSLQSGVNFASSADIVANITNKKYMQAYLVAGGSTSSYSDVNLQISDNGALQINQGFVNGQTLAAGQLVPVEFAVKINSQQPYPIDVTAQYVINSSALLLQPIQVASTLKAQNLVKSNQAANLAAASVSSGQSLYVNATSQSDSSLALKLGNVPLLVAPSDETTAATIYVSSFGRVNDLTIEPDSPNVQVYANSCGSVIESNASCSFKLGVISASSGSSTVVFKVKGTPIYSMVTFYAPTTPVDGEARLVNDATVGVLGLQANQSSSIINLVFSNLGLEALTDLVFTPRNSTSGSSHLEIVSNSCDPKIESQAQCVVQVRLIAATTAEQGSVYLDITGKVGTTAFTTQSNAIDYYVNTSSNLIIASPVGSSATLSVIGNGVESQSAIFTLQNTGSSATTINSTTLNGINLPTSLSISDNQCGNSLPAGQSCNITVKYGPMSLESNQSGVANLMVNYGASTESNNLIGTINYSGIGLDSYLAITNVSASGFSGSGSIASPYAASGCSASPMVITLTYKNMSENFIAQNLALDIIDGHLTPYMSVDASSTCGYGANPKDLGIGQSCDLVLTADKSAMNNNSSYNLDVVYPSASWNTSQGFVTQNNFTYNGSNTTYAGYTQPTLVSTITPTSGTSLNRTLTQTLVNADNCGSLTTNITSLAAFGVTAAPTTTTSGCTVNNDGSVSCVNSSSSASNVINYTLDANIPRPADLFFQFSLQNAGVQIWYNPSILLFNFSN